MKAPAVSTFATSGTGPVFAGSLFPFLFITIACGALSGFHALIASGTTPKLIEKESQIRLIGYGGMLTESFVAIMALITAAILNQHLYFAMNAPAGADRGAPARPRPTTSTASASPAPRSPATRSARPPQSVGEESIVSRTGGAPTLAFGMSEVLHRRSAGPASRRSGTTSRSCSRRCSSSPPSTRAPGSRGSCSRTGSRNLGGPLKKLRNPSWRIGAWGCSVVVVAAWGSILLMGVTDPLGGINTLFPLFGIANQLLAAIALTVVTVVVIKRGLLKWAWIPGVPLAWDLIVTMTASWQKIFSGDPKLGYWTPARPVRRRQGRRQDDVRRGQERRPDRRRHPQHLHPGHAVDRVRGAGAHRGHRRNHRGAQGNPRRRPTAERGRPGAVTVVRTLRNDPHRAEKEVQKQWDDLPGSAAKSVGTGVH